MSKKDDEIKEKLAELEASLVEDSPQKLSVPPKPTTVLPAEESVASDLYMIGGICLLLTGLFLFLHHVRLTTGYLSWLGIGSHGFGFVLVPLIVGIGFLFYDYKNRIGWVLTAASLGLIIFTVLAQLVMIFPSMSLLGVIIMLLPLALGGAFIAKAIQARKPKPK